MTNKNYENSNEKQGVLFARGFGEFYEIHVKGQLNESWSDWLDGMEVRLLENGEMILYGHIITRPP